MKTFLSIGSGPNVGLPTAERFAKEDFRIVLTARDATKTNLFAEQLNGNGYAAEARAVDAADPSSIAGLVSDVEAVYGGIDVLHYNVAAMRKATIMEQPRETFNADLAITIGGALTAVQAVLPKMNARGSGTILFTGGGYAVKPSADHISLSIGKAGIRTLTLALFEGLARSGIHVATVTIGAEVIRGSHEAHTIAELFWSLHSQPQNEWTPEIAYTW